MLNERFLSQKDACLLSRLAEAMLRLRDVKFNFADRLVEFLSGAILLPETSTRDDFVRLNTVVTYRAVGSAKREYLAIVCPQDADDVLARVSVLSPLAMAMLGRVVGSIVEIGLHFGRVQYVEIVDVASIDSRRGIMEETAKTVSSMRLPDLPTAGI